MERFSIKSTNPIKDFPSGGKEAVYEEWRNDVFWNDKSFVLPLRFLSFFACTYVIRGSVKHPTFVQLLCDYTYTIAIGTVELFKASALG